MYLLPLLNCYKSSIVWVLEATIENTVTINCVTLHVDGRFPKYNCNHISNTMYLLHAETIMWAWGIDVLSKRRVGGD